MKTLLNFKSTKILVTCLAVLLVVGCGEDVEFKENNKVAFKACINSGGVPVQAWFNQKVLGDCIYKPM